MGICYFFLCLRLYRFTSTSSKCIRARTGHEIEEFHFPGPESHGGSLLVLKSHEKFKLSQID